MEPRTPPLVRGSVEKKKVALGMGLDRRIVAAAGQPRSDPPPPKAVPEYGGGGGLRGQNQKNSLGG